MRTYLSCTNCHCLIQLLAPEANAYNLQETYGYIDSSVYCNECLDNQIKARTVTSGYQVSDQSDKGE